ncbi:hypothetical protein HQQ94_13885 [Shewanella sp. VB17]|uniref:hypothetical protein n=1 Tax=Shewanella sp. VB17 TaxID=2739432 RepID=UPI0015657F7B|nr:hypothetical protein [Shewanella sp. VB17]NRD74301.1 hypothetical protein [Shewanella sp. VB17]
MFTQVTIIGNAQGNWEQAAMGLTIVFNETGKLDSTGQLAKNLINITNGPFAGIKAPFLVSGLADAEALTNSLVETATDLELALDCWPSTGLVTTVLMSQQAHKLDVARMSLLPSLQRDMNMSATAYLPCMVHNWLGERRIALTLSNSNLNWPQLQLSQPDLPHILTDNEFSHFSALCPFSLLNNIHQQAITEALECEDTLAILAYLANTNIDIWLQHSNQEKLLNCEPLFFNQTPELTSSYWYLINNLASQYLDPIRHRLAYCQQVLSR